MELYGLAVFLNLFINLLLILGTNQILGEPNRLKRTVIAAGVGGIYAALCLRWFALGHTLLRLCVIGVMGKIAFGRFWGKGSFLFMLLQMAVGGLAVGLRSSGIVSVILTTVGIGAMFLSGVWDRRRRLIPVELCYGGRTVCVTALRDTGNTLKDPLTGRSVMVLGADAAAELTGLTPAQLRKPVETLPEQPIPGLRLIPYHTIDTKDGMLLGLWVAQAKIGKEKGGALVALAPEKLSEDGSVQALMGGMA